MPQLAELQQKMADALLGDVAGLPASLFARGPAPIEEALRVHRNTIVGALAKVLRLTYPTVLALVGEAYFDQAAMAYGAEHPPRRAVLSGYGERFADFLTAWPPAALLRYLGDVARLELAIDRAAAGPLLGRIAPIDVHVALSLPVSLAVLELEHPADLIRDAIEAGNDEALAAIDLEPRTRWLAVWRSGDGAAVRTLGRPAGLFLAALLSGRPAPSALAEACARETADAALLAIQAEVFAAPFTAVTQTPQHGDPP